MVKIIFSRIGKKKQPHYRIIVLDKKKDPWGDFLEILGHYNPRTKETILKQDRIKHWLDNGAQPSDTVHNLFVTNGIIKADKIRVSNISKKRQAKITEKTNEANASVEASAKAEEKDTETAPIEETKPEVKETPAEKVKAETPKIDDVSVATSAKTEEPAKAEASSKAEDTK